jgi:hypothetical protein
MKSQAAIIGVVALSIGFAAGSYLVPEVQRLVPSVGGPSASASSSSSSSTMGSTAPVSSGSASAGSAPTLDSLLHKSDSSGNFFSVSYGRMKDLVAYADTVSPDQMPDVLKRVEAIPDFSKKFMFLNVLGMRYAQIDPEGALAWAQKPSGRGIESFLRRNVLAMAYGTLAEQDPVNTLSRVEQLSPGPKRNQAINAVASKLAETDPV